MNASSARVRALPHGSVSHARTLWYTNSPLPSRTFSSPFLTPQKQSRSNKRSFALVEAEFADMARSKKTKPDVDINNLSPSDRQALERVAAIFDKPIPEFCADLSANPTSSTCRRVDTRTNGPETGYGHSRTMSTTQPEDMNNWQHVGHGEFYGYMPFAQLQGFAFAPEVLNQTEIGQLGGGEYTGDSGNLGDLDVSNNGMWSHDADFGANTHVQIANEPPVQRRGPRSGLEHYDAATQVRHDLRYELANTKCLMPNALSTEGGGHVNNPALTAEEDLVSVNAPNVGLIPNTSDPTSNDRVIISSDDFHGSSEDQPVLLDAELFENDQSSMTPRMAGRLGSSASASSSEWSIVEVPQQIKSAEKLSPSSSPRDGSLQWISSDSSSRESSSHQQQRRGPFQSQQLREETSNTRKLKACVRCRMQKIRVRISCSADLQNGRLTQLVSDKQQRSKWCLPDLRGSLETKYTYASMRPL